MPTHKLGKRMYFLTLVLIVSLLFISRESGKGLRVSNSYAASFLYFYGLT